jgi:propanol-preferring alcohol dehydrogenase
MKAWVLRTATPVEQRPLAFVEVPTPQPGAHEVRVRVTVCGICRTDLHLAEGDLAAGKADLILGHEIVGVVDALGRGVSRVREGDRVGITWLGRTCGTCKQCVTRRENYCADFRATGRDLDGGFAEFVLARETAIFPLEHVPLPEEEMAPLLCAGVAGFCAFRLMNLSERDTIGLYGFGPTAYYVLRVARYLGHSVFVSSRSERNRDRASLFGASWTGDAAREQLPAALDAAIVFPPAGSLVETALRQTKPGGTVVLAPVAMSPINISDYSSHLWGRDIRTLYNVNRRDAEEFLELACQIDLGLGTEVVAFGELHDGMVRVKRGELREPNAAVRVSAYG